MKELKRYLDTRMGDFSFYFEDLKSGYSYGLNQKKKMLSAGCIKLPLAIALLKEVENGKLELQTKINIEKTDIEKGGSGIIHEFMQKEYSLLELLTAMLIQSDNTAANKIIKILGIDRINELFRNMGLKNTILRTITSEEKSLNNECDNESTSYELSKCFKILHNCNYLNKEHSDVLLRILKRQQIRNKIPFFIEKEEWANIANKSGSLENVENDAALMNIKKGNFVFTVMSSNLPSNVYGIITISRITKMMWDIIERGWDSSKR